MTDLLLDFSNRGTPTAVHIRSRGYKGVMRYLSWLPNPKVIDAKELAQLHAQGLDVGFVWETTAERAKSGPAGGEHDVLEANRQLDALGAPLNVVIQMATDFPASPNQVRGYYQGAVAASKRPVGIYGGFDVVDALMAEGVVKWGWQTYAWSSGRISKHAQIYQYKNGVNDGGSVDLNQVLHAPWGQWPAIAALPAPTPTINPFLEDNMLYERAGAGEIWITNGIFTIHLFTIGVVDWHLRQGAKFVTEGGGIVQEDVHANLYNATPAPPK